MDMIFWILLHFERTRKPFTKCDNIIGYIKKEHFESYEKNINAYTSLKDKIDTALEHAKWSMKQNQNDLDRGVKINDLYQNYSISDAGNVKIEGVKESNRVLSPGIYILLIETINENGAAESIKKTLTVNARF